MITFYIFTESINFMIKTHYPAVSHGPQYRNMESLTSFHITGPIKPANHG